MSYATQHKFAPRDVVYYCDVNRDTVHRSVVEEVVITAHGVRYDLADYAGVNDSEAFATAQEAFDSRERI